MQYPCNLKNNIYHSNKRGPPPFFHLDVNPVLDHVLIHSVDKTHVLIVIEQFSVRLTKFRRSYVNHPVAMFFCLMWTALFKVATFLFFGSCLSSMIVHLRNLFFLAHLLLECCLLQVGKKKRNHFINNGTMFSANPYLVEEQPVFLYLHLVMVYNELFSHMALQQEIGFYIPLESTCCFFVDYCHEFLNKESYSGFVLPVEREL